MRLLLAALLLTASSLFTSQPVCGQGLCPSYTCYGASCGAGCICMRHYPNPGGTCYSEYLAPGLRGQGYREQR